MNLKEPLLKNAATAMASWLAENHISPDDLERRLLRKEPILNEALNTIPADKIGWVRSLAKPFAGSLNEDDYARILAYLWEVPAARAHAELLHGRYFQSDFVPAMEHFKGWLTGSPA